jgi:hypothetical protein
MRQPLMGWLADVAQTSYGDHGLWPTLCQMLKIDYTSRQPDRAIIEAANTDNDLLLDIVDARLAIGVNWNTRQPLERALFLAGSGWRVNEPGDGLEQVVDATVRLAVMEAIQKAASSPSQHLSNAWSATFGRDKNPTQAHAEMVRAVESAAIPVLTPNDRKATLGTLIGQLESQATLYTTASASAGNDGIQAVVAMMRMLWQQQTDRHGADPTVQATQERVEMLLPVAAALVHTFATSGVRRRQ